ncbi:MAG: DNA polymerase I [Propionibacteriaceae bacterium]|nr:DNA polymerase I [Propionibacteriaceae bacterium]
MSPAAGDKLLLIDGYSVAYRAFFALPVENFATASGQPTNAVYGFTAMLISLLRDERPSHVGVAWDVSRTSFRTAQYQDYKATRSETPPQFAGQAELIKAVLQALAIPSVEAPGYEADDILATWAVQADGDGLAVLVCSGDRDTFQLVTDKVTVLYPRRGVSDLARMTPAAVLEKYGVTPARYPELAALVGETSDNLPGVPGVGPKTAAKWLGQFDGLDNLLSRRDELPGKAGQSLRDHVAQVERNRRLNALVRDLDLPLRAADLARRPWDEAAVAAVFDQLEFRSLRHRLADIGFQAEPTAAPAVAGRRLTPGQVRDWLAEHARPDAEPVAATTAGGDPATWTGLAAVGRWAPAGGDLTGLALAAPDGGNAWLDVADLAPQDDRALADWLADPRRPKAGHGLKGLLKALWQRGWDLDGLACDSELAAYLAHPERRGHDLESLARSYLGRDLAAAGAPQSSPGQAELDFGEADAGAGDRGGDDSLLQAVAVRDLAAALTVDLASRGRSLDLLRELELPLERVLARMEAVGVAADQALLDRLWSDLDAQAVQAAQSAHQVIGHPVNLGSPKQLQAVLFDQLKMPKTRKLKTGYTTDADSLAQLFDKTGHPFLAHLLAYRDAVKLRQTVEGLTKAVGDDGRIHTTYLQTVAATGRLSSAEPNLQNIPVRTATGRQIREAFVAGPGFEALLTADYSQIEMRIMAHLSGDQSLIDAFRSGFDFHAVMAGRVFSLPADQVAPEQRSRIKAMNYGLAYGLSAFGLSGQLGIPVGEAKALMDDYFQVFGPVRDYLDRLVAQARQTGYTETILGRRRYLPDLNSDDRARRDTAERMALNAPIQGSAADIIKLAMIKVDQALANERLASRLLLQVHDELVFEVAPGEADRLEALVRRAMGTAQELSVPLDVSVGLGPNWRAAAH